MSSECGNINALVRLIETLRGENGCPWDKKQTPRSLSVYLIEEVYELVGAIEAGEPDEICEELGDVLFQLLFLTRLFHEAGQFNLEDAVGRIAEKMIRRHPHVFGDEHADTTDQIRMRWHQIKKKENAHTGQKSILDSVPKKLPALMRAYRISERAARTGFDWDNMKGVLGKAEEEWREFNAELSESNPDAVDRDRLAVEFGDVLFTLVNVARFARIHPETALSQSIHKFEKRFQHMERQVAEQGSDLDSVSRDELDRLWESAKRQT